MITNLYPRIIASVTWETVKKQVRNQNYNETAQNQKMIIFYGIDSMQQKKEHK